MSISKEIEVKANVGLHARPAAEFVKLAQQFNGSVKIRYGDREADGKSMIGILKLAIKQGEKFYLLLDGENEETFMNKFEALVQEGE